MEWIDREEWRRKLKLCAQKNMKTFILSTQNKNLSSKLFRPLSFFSLQSFRLVHWKNSTSIVFLVDLFWGWFNNTVRILDPKNLLICHNSLFSEFNSLRSLQIMLLTPSPYCSVDVHFLLVPSVFHFSIIFKNFVTPHPSQNSTWSHPLHRIISVILYWVLIISPCSGF